MISVSLFAWDFLVAQKVSHSMKPLSPKQTWAGGYPTGSHLAQQRRQYSTPPTNANINAIIDWAL